MDTYHTDGTPIEKYPEKVSKPAVESFKRETMNGDSPFQSGRGPGRDAEKETRRYAGDSPEHED